MTQARFACGLFVLTAMRFWALGAGSPSQHHHQVPDRDGVYYVGPEISAPRMVRTVSVPYPDTVSTKDIQGMTVLAMVIDSDGIPKHVQVLHTHGDAFDQASNSAVQHSAFEPGRLGDRPVPVWIDARIVFRADRSQAVPQVLITERDLPVPDDSQWEDKHHNPLSYTPPFPIHTVDADFADPFSKYPYVQVAVVEVLVDDEGLPREVHVRRGLGFGLDRKALPYGNTGFLPPEIKANRLPRAEMSWLVSPRFESRGAGEQKPPSRVACIAGVHSRWGRWTWLQPSDRLGTRQKQRNGLKGSISCS